jgi:hypothetical protein
LTIPDDLIKRRAELTVSVMKQVPAIGQKAPLLHRYVPTDLFHPLFIRMRGHSGQADLATLQMNEEKDIVGDQSLECDNFDSEEVGPGQNIQMSADEVFPTGGVLSLVCRKDVVATEDITDRLV